MKLIVIIALNSEYREVQFYQLELHLFSLVIIKSISLFDYKKFSVVKIFNIYMVPSLMVLRVNSIKDCKGTVINLSLCQAI